jgi:ADP-heptose:LPS heptosyltransferase
LIYRLGSLGDTMVALPALRLLARAFPDAERIVLTNQAPVNGVSMATLLAGCGLVHRFIEYRPGERSPRVLWRLSQTLRALRADLVVYLAEPRGTLAVWRDLAFFRLCGIRRIVGAPLHRDLREHRWLPDTDLWESEASRLARCIADLGNARLDRPESWSPNLSADDHAAAERVLASWAASSGFVALAVGARVPGKDWGEDHWAALIPRLEARWPGLGLMLIGGPVDRPRVERLAELCRGAVLDRGAGDLRLTMALLGRARLLVTTDGGPMHMAAALGVPTVSIFAATPRPGIWFPAGDNHIVLRPPPQCRHGNATIRAVTVDSVAAACTAQLGEVTPARPRVDAAR